MRIVLIDDEAVTLNGLSHAIQSLDPAWEIVGTFTDASQALECCDWDQIDLAFLDITMPSMDGLSFAQTLRENEFAPLLVFLTAHANFSYAQQAAHFQMFDYLLKPTGIAELRAVLMRADAEVQKRHKERASEKYINDNLHVLRKYYLGDVMFEEQALDQELLEKNTSLYRLERYRYQICLFRSSLNRVAVKERLAKHLTPDSWMVYGQSDCYELLLLIAPGQDAISFDFISDIANTWKATLQPVELTELSAAFVKLLSSTESRQSQETAVPQGDLQSALQNKPLSASVRLAVEYIEQNYAQHLSLNQIADHVYLHPTYLSNVFKRQTGFSIVDYISEVRMRKAMELLRDPRNKIYWIVEQVGFSNQRYFSSVFRKVTGMSPMQYRQSIMM